jgi:hypothetical protein
MIERNKFRSTMIARSVAAACILVSCSIRSAIAQVFPETTVACPNSAGVVGYDSIAAMNSDMQAELQRVQQGSPSQNPYILVLCPGTVFDVSASGPLTPLLGGAVFTCGASGDPSENCAFSGGDVQIMINQSMTFPALMVSFIGMTFLNFTTAAIAGTAGFNSTVDVYQSNFEVRTVLSISGSKT